MLLYKHKLDLEIIFLKFSNRKKRGNPQKIRLRKNKTTKTSRKIKQWNKQI